MSSAPRRTRRHSPSTGDCCGKRARHTAASRSTRKATRSSSPSRPHRGRSMRRVRSPPGLASGPIRRACRACIRGHRSSPTRAMSAQTSIGRRGSLRPATAGRCSSRPRRRRSSTRTACSTSASTALRTSRLQSGSTSSASRTFPLSGRSTARTCRCRRRPSSAESASSRRSPPCSTARTFACSP